MIWIKVNGTSVPDSSTRTAFKQNDEVVITCEYFLDLNAGDAVQVWVEALTANCTIDYISAGGAGANAYPGAPGVITNIQRIR